VGALFETSPSQVRQAEGCLRVYLWGQVDGVYAPQKRSQEDGDELHTINENYVKLGLDFPDTPIGRLARLGKDHLPTRADDPLVERKERMVYAGVAWKVKPDLSWLAPISPIVMDYKLVTHYGFALTPQKLRADLQACIYAYLAMERWQTDSTTCVWLYYRNSLPPEVKPVEAEITRDDARRVLGSKRGLLEQMAKLKRERTRALDVVPNRAHCTEFGGCWYRPKCFPAEFAYEADGIKVVEVGGPEVEYRAARRGA
jgi:hypothetical protein